MLRKFCYCVGLRRGCFAIACVDFIINLVILILIDDVSYINHVEKAVGICHCMGCIMLALGSLIQSTVLLVFYLITSLVNVGVLCVCVIMLV
ncbi:CG42531, partial [Drosophila busckii]